MFDNEASASFRLYPAKQLPPSPYCRETTQQPAQLGHRDEVLGQAAAADQWDLRIRGSRLSDSRRDQREG